MKKESWSTRIGVILAVMGSAVGLGNFLRFPGKAAQYEGGAFMIPYFIALFLLGLPIAWAEWAMGRHGGSKGFNSIPGIFRAIWKSKAAPYLGALGLLIPVAIYMYYVYIEAWCLGYAWKFVAGDMALGTDKQAYVDSFKDFVGMRNDGDAFSMNGGVTGSALTFLALCFVLNFVLIYRGLSKGIEWFCKWAMPALVFLAFVVLIRVLTLGAPDPQAPQQNVNEGLGYMWNPIAKVEWTAPTDKALKQLILAYDKEIDSGADKEKPSLSGEQVLAGQWHIDNKQAFDRALQQSKWTGDSPGPYRNASSRLVVTVGQDDVVKLEPKSFWRSLANAQMWLEAAGQIFFSLSVGFGIICCYASYLKPSDDIALSGLTASAGNEFCEVALGGLITIPAAFVFLGAVGVSAAAGSTFNLGFMTLPMVFEHMPFGRWVGAAFFFLLFLAAVTSSLSMLQPAIALFEEGLGLGRKASVALLGFITAAGCGFVVWFSKDAKALDTMDFWVGSVAIYILATVEVILFGWVMGLERGHEELNHGAGIKIPRLVMYVTKYLSPVFLVGVFVVWLYQQITTEDDNYFLALRDSRVARLSVIAIVVLLVLFIFLIARSVQRWQTAETKKEASP